MPPRFLPVHARSYRADLLACTVFSLLLLLALAGCDRVGSLRGAFDAPPPHTQYAEKLHDAGLDETVAGRAWLQASNDALARAHPVSAPLREVGFFDPMQPSAVGYRIDARRGQQLTVRLTTGLDTTSAARFFADLFLAPADSLDPPRHIAHADTNGLITTEVTADRAYLLRVQPELLEGGRYTVEIQTDASLTFPVAGHDSRAVRSYFGDARDGGARRHHGVDIFAPRGTPVVAAAPGSARPGTNNLGGNVVWLRDDRGRAFYYAHLDTQLVSSWTRVQAGDTLGLVGNSGNARSTPPHLHFGIYSRGPVDPFPFVDTPSELAAAISADTTRLGQRARVQASNLNLRTAPSTSAAIARRLPRHLLVEVVASTGAWHRVRLPDGMGGYVAARLVDLSGAPLRTAQADTTHALRASPSHEAVATGHVAPGTPLAVLGTFEDYAYVEVPDTQRAGWVRL